MKVFKQATSREYAKETGAQLWQKKFHDHILRPKDSANAVSWYIWMNPVRKGLCGQPDLYPYSGSFTRQWGNTPQPKDPWIPAHKKDVLGPFANRMAPTKSLPLEQQKGPARTFRAGPSTRGPS
jgi:hypothetical protein